MEDNMNDYSQATPTLTFDPFEEEKIVTANVHQELKGERQVFDESRLTPEERRMVDDFASKIDLTNSSLVMQFGVGAQKKIADFSETALNNVRTKDMGEVGKMLGDMVMELRNFDIEEEDKGFLGFFKKSSNKLSSMQTRYATAETNVNRITEALEKQKGIKVDKRKVELEMPLRNVGRAEVKIKTYQGVIGKLTVIIKGEA